MSLTSKEWVLPPRPRAGRKPVHDVPRDRRKAQNRVAQKAFQERRAARVGILEERLRELESRGEQERKVLRATIMDLQHELDGCQTELSLRTEQITALERQLKNALTQTVETALRPSQAALREELAESQKPQGINAEHDDHSQCDTTPAVASYSVKDLNFASLTVEQLDMPVSDVRLMAPRLSQHTISVFGNAADSTSPITVSMRQASGCVLCTPIFESTRPLHHQPIARTNDGDCLTSRSAQTWHVHSHIDHGDGYRPENSIRPLVETRCSHISNSHYSGDARDEMKSHACCQAVTIPALEETDAANVLTMLKASGGRFGVST